MIKYPKIGWKILMVKMMFKKYQVKKKSQKD